MQELAVAIIVSLAALYLGAKYMPAGLRARLVTRLSAGKASFIARWLDKSGGGGGCGGGSCGTGCSQQQSSAQPDSPGKHRVIKLHQR